LAKKSTELIYWYIRHKLGLAANSARLAWKKVRWFAESKL